MSFYTQDFQLAVGATGGSPTLLIDVQTEDVALGQAFNDLNGAKGSIGRYNSRVRADVKRVGGPLSLFPSANDLAFFLPRILGGTPAGTTYPLAEAPTAFVLWKVMDTQVMKYADVVVDRATFSSGQGQGLRLDLDLVAKDEDASALAATFPALTLGETAADQPFVHTDSAFTLNAVEYDIPDLNLSIAWGIDREAFRNNLTLAHLRPTDRVVTWANRVPGSWDAVRQLAAGSAVPFSVTYTNGAVSFSATSPLVRIPARTPGMTGRGEQFYSVSGQAFRTAAAAELTTTLDNTV